MINTSYQQPKTERLRSKHGFAAAFNCRGITTTISTFDIRAGLPGLRSGAILCDLLALDNLASQLPSKRPGLVTHPHRKGIDEMELQDSVTQVTNLTPSLLGVWDRLKSTPDEGEDSFDSEHTVALRGSTGSPTGQALANPESAQEQASLDREFAAALSESDYARASDDQLLAAAKASDDRAFEELSGRYIRAMRKRVYLIVRNLEDAEDVVQDTLLKAYRHLQEFRETCAFSTWISRIATNTALMLLRKRKSRPEVPYDHAGEADQSWSTWDIPDPSPSTERAYARRETLEYITRAVKGLPARYRGILEQYHVEDKSLQEAADGLGITVASAKLRLFRARRTLRSRLEGQRISIVDACY